MPKKVWSGDNNNIILLLHDPTFLSFHAHGWNYMSLFCTFLFSFAANWPLHDFVIDKPTKPFALPN